MDDFQRFINRRNDDLNNIRNTNQNNINQGEESEEDYDDQVVEYKKIVKKNILIINSKDRTWTWGQTSFNFSIDVSPDKNIKNGFIIKTLKNIRSFSVEHVLLPNFYIRPIELHALAENNSLLSTNTLNPIKLQRLSDLPYIVIRIDDLENTQDGTNKTINQATSILVIDSQTNTVNNSGVYNYNMTSSTNIVSENANDGLLSGVDRSYIHYTPSTNVEKLFYPCPKSVIGILHITFLTPEGEVLSFMNDYLTLKGIYYTDTFNGGSFKALKIITREYFSPEEYYVGSTIYIEGAKITDNSPLSNFLNKESGHTILKTEKTLDTDDYSPPNFDNSKLRNIIVIPFEYKFNSELGTFSSDANYGIGDSPDEFTTITSGTLINYNLQNLITLKVDTEEKDNSEFFAQLD